MDISSSHLKRRQSRRKKNEFLFGEMPVLSSILFFKGKVNAVLLLTAILKFQMLLYNSGCIHGQYLS